MRCSAVQCGCLVAHDVLCPHAHTLPHMPTLGPASCGCSSGVVRGLGVRVCWCVCVRASVCVFVVERPLCKLFTIAASYVYDL